MEGITDADYVHAKKVCKDFKIRNLGDFHDMFTCLEMHKLDPAHFLSAPELAWQAALKRPE